MENTNIPFISHDQTIIEVLDEKYKKYLIPRANIIKAKHILSNTSYSDDYITLHDKDNQPQSILTSKLMDLNEDNITYHWLEVADVDEQPIIVKREQLLEHKMTKEPTKIMDYYRKNKKIIPGKVCRKAKKYHPMEGEGIENILFKVQDENNVTQFVTKPQIKFAKKKRMLNDETFSIEITNKDNTVITVPLENIRNIDEENAYKEYCEIVDVDNNSIIVRKTDLQDLKEIHDKNLIKETIQHISDYNYSSIYKIKPNEQYLKLFPNKYSYIPNGESIPWIGVRDVNGKSFEVKTSLIEHYINENINELAISEEVNDLNYNTITINPFDIVKNIMMTYDDISCKNGPFIELATQSGTKHLIRKHTIQKVFKLQKEGNDYINIKDSNNVKILTRIQKLLELDLDSAEVLLIPLEDVTGKVIYVKKSIVIGIVNKIVKGESNEECESVIDNKGEKRIINKNFINDIPQLNPTSSNENSSLNNISTQSEQPLQIPIPNELQCQIKLFFSSNNIASANEFLHNFLTMNNYNIFEQMLFNSNDPHQKFFSAESLIYLYTHYPLIINHSTAFDLYKNVLSLIYENAENLYKKTKYVFNTLIKLLCRIIRLFIFQNSQNRTCIYSDILSNIKDDSIYSLIIPFEIFTELIYQFQSNESVQYSSYHQFKMHKMISEFKDTILLPIFEYSITNLINLFQHQIKTENFNEFVMLMNAILKCTIETLDYEDDLNSKEDNYAKYEIKPVYIPNLKRKTRDKTLDLHLISLLMQSLFESYLIILKSTNDPSKGTLCLILLQKFLVMKSMYLGEGKFAILEIYQEGIWDILFTKNGFVNHSHVCKIIYFLKKNYTYFDLVERDAFLNYVFTFANETFDKAKSDYSYYEGLVYLMRFYGYFSHSIEMLPFFSKEHIGNSIKEFCVKFINEFNVNEDVDLFHELSKAIGICGECEYMDVLNRINELLVKDEGVDIAKKSFCILSGVELIKRHYKFYLEEKMISKGSEDELKEFTLELDEMNNTMYQKTAIGNFIVEVFDMINSNISNNNEIQCEIVQIAFVKFVKFYIKHFLSLYLKNKFIDIHSQILEKIKLHSFNELLIYIIKTLFYLSTQIHASHHNNAVMKSLHHLFDNIKIEQSFNYSQQNTSKFSLGKLTIFHEQLIPSLQSLYKFILSYNLNNNTISQNFYEIIYKLFNLFPQLETNIHFYLQCLNEQGVHHSNIIYALSAIFTSISNQNDYSIIIELLMQYMINVIRNLYMNSVDIDNCISFQILQLMIDITSNNHNKINFNTNSQCPYQIISVAKELLCHYYRLAREIKEFKSENDKYAIQIKPIAMFSHIFTNIFHFVQLNLLVQSNYEYIKSLFDLLSELILSINSYDVYAYIDDLMHMFDLLKVIYCDFVCVKPDICKSEYIGKIIEIMGLAFEYQCCNGKEYQLDVVSKCSGILYEWGSMKRKWAMRSVFNGGNDNEEHCDIVDIVFEQYGKQLSDIMNEILNKFVRDDKTLQLHYESYVNCLFVLVFQYEEKYLKVCVDIVRNSSLHESEKEKMFCLFKDVVNNNSMNNNDGISFYNSFKEKVNNLYDNIKTIIINHSNSYMKY